MDTSTSATHETTAELLRSVHPEDVALAKEYEQTFHVLLAALRPSLRYLLKQVDTTQGVLYLLPIAETKEHEREAGLCVDRAGDSYWVLRTDPIEVRLDADAWKAFNFEEIVAGFTEAFEEAKKRREEHLASINRRRAMLADIQKVILRAAQ